MPSEEWKLASLRKFRDLLNEVARVADVPQYKGQAKSKVTDLYKLLLEKYETTDEAVAAKLQAAEHEWLTAAEPAAPAPAGGFTFRVQTQALLVTYNSKNIVLATWARFLAWIATFVETFQVRRWSATLEESLHAADAMDDEGTGSGRYHLHAFFEFWKSVDWASPANLMFDNIRPRIDINWEAALTDTASKAARGRGFRASCDGGHMYVYMDKVGSVEVAANYVPFRDYVPDPSRLERWWGKGKLADQVYEYYIAQIGVGCSRRFADLDARRKRLEALEQRKTEAEMAEVVARFKANVTLLKPFPEVPEVVRWKTLFQHDALRYPILVLDGPSYTGKTEFANSLFKNALELKIGMNTAWPSRMRDFERGKHDALILDDVRDLSFVVENQDKLQGKYNALIEFSTTAGGTCAYAKWLFAVPVVVTINLTTRHRAMLTENDWLAHPRNRVVVQWPPPGFSFE